MKSKTLWILLWLSIVTCGLLLRVTALNARPMHTDESVHAYKFKQLLEEGLYRYDPDEYHGPVLNYLTLASAFVRGERTYTQIDEATLRLVPAVFGTLLILTPLLFAGGLGKRAVLFSAVLIAFSPAFVYYSRYYIQEMLLVFFTACFLGTVWQYFTRLKAGWLVLAGACLGLMHASKETFVFSIAAAVGAILIMMWRCRFRVPVHLGHIFSAAVSYAIVSVAFFSSFGTNPQGIVDSFATYGVWMQRAGGQSVHVHPWYYYLDLLTWTEFLEPLTWNEDGIVALAVIGMIVLLAPKSSKPRPLAVFVACYTLLLTTVYCVIPYKTPWSMLSFLFGMAVVGGYAADRILCLAKHWGSKIAFGILLFIYGLISPLVQSNLLAFDYASDPTNPYVYAHTGDNIFRMVRQVREIAFDSGQGRVIPVQVIAERDDYWPLPWYLRDFTNVGYWDHVDSSAADAPMILAQARLEQPLLQMLYSVPAPGHKHLYLPMFEAGIVLRPGVYWQGYIRKDLWDKMQPTDQSSDLQTKGTLMDLHSETQKITNLHRYSHSAMNTTFGIFIQHSDAEYAAGAARAAFAEADRLERLLSRFIENSDISRINSTPAGQTVVVDEDTMQCLVTALRAYSLTDGVFDINYGGAAGQSEQTSLTEAVQLDSDMLEVRLNAPVQLDLGGIGKGFAVDKIAGVLQKWSITKALIHAGASSVAALQPPDETAGWPVTFSDPRTGMRVSELLCDNEVLSGSGIAKGGHIINPTTGKIVQDRLACWVRLPGDAAMADALSTAGMLLSPDELRKLQNTVQGCSMLLTGDNGQTDQLTLGERFKPS